MESTGNNTITGNTISGNNIGSDATTYSEAAIYLDQSSNSMVSSKITGNTIENNLHPTGGIHVYGGTGNIITGNTITNNNGKPDTSGIVYGSGILVSNSNKNTISSNTVKKENMGIRIEASSNNSIESNILTENYTGLNLVNKCQSNTIRYNSIYNNSWIDTSDGKDKGKGVDFQASPEEYATTNSNVLSYNNIWGNAIPIYYANGTQLTATHNYWGGAFPSNDFKIATCPYLKEEYSPTGSTVLGGSCLGEIEGSVYIDGDKDGIFDTGEAGIPNWNTITLYKGSISTDSIVKSVSAGSDSKYKFEDLVDGTYYVCEGMQGKYYQTGPIFEVGHTEVPRAVRNWSANPSEGSVCWRVDIAGDMTVKNIDFGNLWDGEGPSTPSGLYMMVGNNDVRVGCGGYISPAYNGWLWTYWSPSTDSGSGVSYYKYLTLHNTEQDIWEYVGSETNITGTSSDGSLSGVPDGRYQFEVQAVDKVGNTSPFWSNYCKYTIDGTSPSIDDFDDVKLIGGSSFPTDDVVAFSDNFELSEVCGKAKDMGSNEESGEICASVDSSTVDENGKFKLMNVIKEKVEGWKGVDFDIVDLTVIPAGTYKIDYYAVDKAGNKSTSQSFTIIIVEDTVPSVSITADRTEITEGDEDVVLSASVTGGNEPFTYLWGGLCSGTESTTKFSGSNKPGTYGCFVTVTDADGDTVRSNTVYITVGAVLGASTVATTTTTTTTTTSPKITILPNLYAYADIQATSEELTPEEEIPDDLTNEELVQGASDEETPDTCENLKKVSGYVYEDENKNGEMDGDEKGIKGVKVIILDSDNEVEKELITDENGYWESELCTGKYTVNVKEDTLPTNMSVENDLSFDVSDEDSSVTFNIELSDERGFWQKNWYLVVGGLVVIVAVYVTVINRKKEII